MTQQTYLYTKEQLQAIFAGWKRDFQLPTKKENLTLFFPGEYANFVTISIHNKKSTSGKPLYKVEMEHKTP